MKIGKALRVERLKLGLTQQQMCEGIISRPFYAKVESGKNKINAESLFQILFKHQIEIDDFCQLIQDTYITKNRRVINKLQERMDYAFSTKDIDSLILNCKKIMNVPGDRIIKLRTLVAIAYFRNELNEIDNGIKKKIKIEFNEGQKWTKRPESLRLFANTMPLWSQDELIFFIGRLLATVKNENITELMLERYLRIFENYLATCYERKIPMRKNSNHIEEIIDYITNATSSNVHLMIYRINAIYMKSLFKNDKEKVTKIKADMNDYGYGKLTINWPN
ncbi:helix-turn-helix domain-containing protein [Lactobacillus gallinarum]|uniref:helix-turn-helix domain-containing protein n=1 Tax=Lactobacillus gallinarum TaxID=52242 RepID=UPI00242B181A|nr:helix-turn-helix transcriptional regulator [Lactobacillus gallinarum]